MSLELEFVPYNEALALKELGFDEPCFNYYSTPNHPSLQPSILLGINPSEPLMSGEMYKIGVWKIKAPLYQQAFQFLLDILNDVSITYWNDGSGNLKTTLEGIFFDFNNRKECLIELINLVKLKK